jgi:hypothetical protein
VASVMRRVASWMSAMAAMALATTCASQHCAALGTPNQSHIHVDAPTQHKTSAAPDPGIPADVPLIPGALCISHEIAC